MDQPVTLISKEALNKLRWRCRRGLLENDLFLERFFDKYSSRLTVNQGLVLEELMELHDHELLDLNLGRKQLSQLKPDLDREDVYEVLLMLREKP
jgi:antitoxin CptB